jgi:3-methylcrotonyl-CoA carboxylase alpha subunit
MRRAFWPRRARRAVEAIHPGYGFWPRTHPFGAACTAAGFTFVGPPAQHRGHGFQILAKTRMRAAGVPLLPGYASGEQQDLTHLAREALPRASPLIVRDAAAGASAGKGMQIVRREAEIAPALAAARRLARSSPATARAAARALPGAPRHIEVQVFADRHGTLRAPGGATFARSSAATTDRGSPGAAAVPSQVRACARRKALIVARAVDYVGAGTVEFLYDAGEFYFMEMNTRLQVEHTVTEAITGLDLVEWQLRVAAGEMLPLRQEQIHFRGHAIEARV